MNCTIPTKESIKKFEKIPKQREYIIDYITHNLCLGSIHEKIISEKYLPTLHTLNDLESRITLIKSPCGTGKNFTKEPLIRNLLKDGKRVIIIVPRISLGATLSEQYYYEKPKEKNKNLINELNLFNQHDNVTNMLEFEKCNLPFYQDEKNQTIKGSCSICLDSIQRIDLSEPIDLLIIDEAAQQSHHSFGGTLKKRYIVEKINKHLQDMINVSCKIIFQDADLDWETITHCLWWSKLIPDSPFLKETCQLIVNTESPVVPTVYARSEQGLRPRKFPTEFASSEIYAQWQDIKNAINSNWKVYIYSTTRSDAKLLNLLIKKEFPKLRIALCTSETSGDDEIGPCLRDPSLFAKNYDVVIGSPAIQTGISIEEVNTWRVFGWIKSYEYNGYSPNAMDVYQGMSRIRKPVGNRWDMYFYNNTIDLKSGNDLDPWYLYNTIQKIKKATDKELELIDFDVKYKVQKNPIFKYGPEYHFRDSVLKTRLNKYSGHLGDKKIKSKFNSSSLVIRGSFYNLCEEKKIPYEDVLSICNQKDANWLLNVLHDFSYNIKYEQEISVVNAEHISKEECDLLRNDPKLLKNNEIRSKIISYDIRKFYNLRKLTLEYVRHYFKGGKIQIYNYVQTDEAMKNNLQAIFAIDARQSGRWSGYRNDVGCKSLLKREIWRLLGINDGFDNAVKEKTILKNSRHPDVINYFTEKKCEELKNYGFPKIKLDKLSYFIKNFAKTCSIELTSSKYEYLPNNKKERLYHISSVEEIKKKSRRYREIMNDPGKMNDFDDLLIFDDDLIDDLLESKDKSKDEKIEINIKSPKIKIESNSEKNQKNPDF